MVTQGPLSERRRDALAQTSAAELVRRAVDDAAPLSRSARRWRPRSPAAPCSPPARLAS
jgi:hypothetical protein